MLQRMNKAGLLYWRSDQTRNSILSNYAAELQITNSAITKNLDEEILITCPRLSNEYAKKPPPPI